MKDKSLALLIIALCVVAALVSIFKPTAGQRSSSDTNSQIDTEFIKKTLGKNKIKVIPLEGVIYDSFAASSPFRADYNAAYLKEQLQKAFEDDKTKAVLLRMNSPGGTVAASQEIYNEVLKLRRAGKPVVVSMTDVCASGCYYIASAADKIVANKGTLTGSIGVISQGLNYKELFEKLGLRNQTFKAGKYKDLGNGARDITEEERKILQALIDDSYNQFLEDINHARGIDMAKLKRIAQGLIYTGKQALDVNLVDSLGTYDDAKGIIVDLLVEAGQANAAEYDFDEVWKKTKLSSLESIFDLNPFSSKLSNSLDFLQNNYTQLEDQLMWLAN